MLNVKFFVCNPFQENTYVIWDENKTGAILDCGPFTSAERSEISDFIEKEGIKITALLNTHLHLDHCFGNEWAAEKYGVEPTANRLDVPIGESLQRSLASFNLQSDVKYRPVQHFVEDGDVIQVGQLSFTCLLVPGHSPGSICYYCAKEEVLFSGDVLFKGSVGRTDLPGGNTLSLLRGINEKIKPLPQQVTICCGHGLTSTIGEEIKNNPYLKQ